MAACDRPGVRSVDLVRSSNLKVTCGGATSRRLWRHNVMTGLDRDLVRVIILEARTWAGQGRFTYKLFNHIYILTIINDDQYGNNCGTIRADCWKARSTRQEQKPEAPGLPLPIEVIAT